MIISTCDNTNLPFYEIIATDISIQVICPDGDLSSTSFFTRHNTRDWTTLFVEWIPLPNKRERCNYIINNDVSKMVTFNYTATTINFDKFWIGARAQKTKYLLGEICSLEIYEKVNCNESIPPVLRDLVISNQMIK